MLLGIFGLMPLFSLGLWPHVTRSWSFIHILKFLNYHLLLGSYCMYYVSFQIRMENNKDLIKDEIEDEPVTYFLPVKEEIHPPR